MKQTQNSDLILPDAVDIERFVLGAVLTHERQSTPLEVIIGSLTEGDFTVDAHRRIFAIASELTVQGRHVDRATVSQELLRRGQESPVSLLLSLTDGMPELFSLSDYLAILREKTRLRSIISGLEDLQTRAVAQDESGAILGDLARFGETLTAGMDSKEDLRQVEEIVEEAGSVDAVMHQRAEGAIAFPVAWLNDKMDGLKSKALTLLAARPSVGKSALALQIAAHAASRGRRTLFYSLEMSGVDLVRRMVSQGSRVNLHRIRLGCADETERARAWSGLECLLALEDRLLISDRANGTIPQITQALHNLKAKRKPADLLVVDYLQLMSPVGRFGNRTEEVSSLSRGLKMLAQTFDIPVLALSQLSRESEKQDREPRLSDLRDSGTLEQDADNVIFLHRRGAINDNPQNVRLILAKQRNGEVGRCDLLFFKQYVRFEEAEAEEAA